MPAFPGVMAEEYPTGEYHKYISSQDAGKVALDESLSGIGKQAGQSQSAESQQVIQNKLHGKEHIRIEQKL